MARTHYPDKWVRYVDCMVQGMSLPKIADKLDIHVSTAFYWRHKILSTLQKIDLPSLHGIVEADETYVLESKKGKNQVKNLGTRDARKRGGVATKRGISDEQVCVVVAIDRQKNVVAKTSGCGRPTSEQIDAVIGSHLEEVTRFCTDSATYFKTFSKQRGFEHEAININQGIRVKKGIFHVQNVNAWHKRLKDWFQRFYGVATKYLDNYLFWFRFIDLNRRMANHPLKMAMVHEVHRVPNDVKAILFRPGLLALAANA
jgi:hypothetical protein